MTIPTILSGAAGRALRTLTPLTTPSKGLDALQPAASSMATRRVVIGTLAAGGALAGLLALRGAGGGGDSQPMAPGPIGERYQPAEAGVQV